MLSFTIRLSQCAGSWPRIQDRPGGLEGGEDKILKST
jgi:hypothetical protein